MILLCSVTKLKRLILDFIVERRFTYVYSCYRDNYMVGDIFKFFGKNLNGSKMKIQIQVTGMLLSDIYKAYNNVITWQTLAFRWHVRMIQHYLLTT